MSIVLLLWKKIYGLSRIIVSVQPDVHIARSVAQDNIPIKKVLGSVKCVKLVHTNPTQDRPNVFRAPMEPRQGFQLILHFVITLDQSLIC